MHNTPAERQKDWTDRIKRREEYGLFNTGDHANRPTTLAQVVNGIAHRVASATQPNITARDRLSSSAVRGCTQGCTFIIQVGRSPSNTFSRRPRHFVKVRKINVSKTMTSPAARRHSQPETTQRPSRIRSRQGMTTTRICRSRGEDISPCLMSTGEWSRCRATTCEYRPVVAI